MVKFLKHFFDAAMVLAVGFLVYQFVVTPQAAVTYSADTPPNTPVYWEVGSEEWSYTALGVTVGDGETISLSGSRMGTSASPDAPRIDRSADNAWHVVTNHLGCPQEALILSDPDFKNFDMTFVDIEGKELRVPKSVRGYSGGLVFVLAQASYATGFVPEGKIAATGAIDAYGAVIPIGGAEHKAQAALDAGVEILFVHPANYAAVDTVVGGQITLIEVRNATQVLDYFSFPAIADCSTL